MRVRTPDLFATIHAEGGVLPADLLGRIADGSPLFGIQPSTYGLAGNERFGEAITRSWNRLLGTWAAFSDARGKLAPSDRAGALTRDRWLAILLEELRFGRITRQPALEVDGREFSIHAVWQGRVPLHLVGAGVELDRQAKGVVGAAKQSPHSLLQELLNRSPQHLWGIASNGLRLRLLRDNVSLTRQSYVEFDLEAMFTTEAYADFVVLWLTCHASRFEGERAADCWLERWSRFAAEEGVPALNRLRCGVQEAVELLGTGFLAHSANTALIDDLANGVVSDEQMRRYLLRLVYRLLFLFVAEDREVLLVGRDAEARERYRRHYATRRLRVLAGRRRGGRHHDLYEQHKIVTSVLREDGCAPLALPALGSFLWSPEAVGPLTGARIDNRHFLEAVLALAYVEQDGVRRAVDFRNLGAEELGSIYEALLELRPRVHLGARRFELVVAAGSERKETGSYYTPTSLISALLDSALEPVLERAWAATDPEAALLGLRVVDPACGSGHFLIAAANRIARRVAQVRTDELEPPPADMRHAVRDVIAHCIYGVDVSPMAVELCKVSLWLEALEPGRPLSFLDHRIVSGNSLLGATPELIAAGVPDAAYKTLLGDDPVVVRAHKARNKQEQRQLVIEHFTDSLAGDEADLAAKANVIESTPDVSLEDIRLQEERHHRLVASAAYERQRWAADAWCAAFVAPRGGDATAVTQDLVARAATTGSSGLSREERDLVAGLADTHCFFHWHVAFPEVTAAGGFDAVLGNPPWERIKLQEKEWFATRHPGIATIKTKAAREKLLQDLPITDPPLWSSWQAAKRAAEAASHFSRASNRYPLCGRGDVNTYALFAELMRDLIGPTGHVGVIVPTGIATDDTTRFFFQSLVKHRSLETLLSFENEDRVFPGIHNQLKFCLLVLRAPDLAAPDPEFVFFARSAADLLDEWRRFSLSVEDFWLLSPNTGTCPAFRSGRDAEVTRAIYRSLPPLVKDEDSDEAAWGITYRRMFDMATDSGLFSKTPEPSRVPLNEGKMFSQFDHRFGTYDGQTQAQSNKGTLPRVNGAQHRDAAYRPAPNYWVKATEVRHIAAVEQPPWFVAFRRFGRSVDFRTVVASALPWSAVGDSAFLVGLAHRDARQRLAFIACANSWALDYVARQKMTGANLSLFILKQVPTPTPAMLGQPCHWDAGRSLVQWLSDRALELVYTAHDLDAIAEEDPTLPGPFVWDADRRELIRAELDGAMLHLYGLDRSDAEHVLDSFGVARKYDEAEHGEFRTKRLVLERYDALAEAMASGRPYCTILDPPPGDVRVTHAAAKATA